MGREFNHNKIEEICDFIIEVSKGNFTLQVNPKNSGELEPLMMLHNMMNEELNTLFHHAHSAKSNPEVILLTILIDSSLRIQFISPQSVKFLEKEDSPKKLREILSIESFNKLQELLETSNEKLPKRKLNLEFRNKSGLLLKTRAEVLKIQNDLGVSGILINALKLTYRNKKLDIYRKNRNSTSSKYPTRNRSIFLQENREMIERLHDHLLRNLDQKFPGMKELSKIFNASESKLKKGFKHSYSTSIYKYFNEKRFERARLLLTETEKQVSTIARECGFISASHFSRSFKEHFGKRPSDIQRNPE